MIESPITLEEKPSFASVIKNKGFRYLWFNQILVQLSYNTLNFALIVWVFKLTNSNFAVAMLMIAVYLPALIFGVFAGVFVDISNRRTIIRWIDFLLILSFVSFIFIKGSYPLILINTFFINALAQFFLPCESSAIPKLVDSKKLLLANSLFSITLYGSFMVGFAMAGPILNVFGIDAIFVMGTVAMIIAFILSQRLPNILPDQISSKLDTLTLANFGSMIRLTIDETKKTLNFIRGKLSVSVAIGLLAAMQGIIGVLAVTMPSYMERVLHIHATDASFVLMIPLGLGMMTGALLIGRFGSSLPRRYLIVPGIVISGILFFLMGATPMIASIINATDLPSRIIHPRFFFRAPSLSFYFASGAFFLGLCAIAVIVPSQTVLQENTGEKIRGKIFAVLGVLMNIFAAVPVIITGAFADWFGVTPIFVIMGVIIFIIGLLALKPAFFFSETHLPYRFRQFLGLGHWQTGNK